MVVYMFEVNGVLLQVQVLVDQRGSVGLFPLPLLSRRVLHPPHPHGQNHLSKRWHKMAETLVTNSFQQVYGVFNLILLILTFKSAIQVEH